MTLANGFEERNTPWEHARRRYDAGLSIRSLEDVEEVLAFFEARRGELYGFRWKDWVDYKSCLPKEEIAFDDQVLGSGDGASRAFQLCKTYVSGSHSYVRPIVKPVPSTVKVGVGGLALMESVGYDVDYATGLITLAIAPAEGEPVTAGFEFDVPVRFNTDRIHVSAASFQAGEMPSVPVVELRV
ncbi:hypothetical protein RGUI_0310 [Rhodovulum sp. P5]|nr:hypothetical protein RGUI_0310 [Rhodovulum sp. P5]